MFKNIDERLEDIGFKKLGGNNKESRYGVYYKRFNKEFKYYQRLDICHKADGNHLIISYQEGTNSDKFNNTVGLTYKEMKLVMKKYKQMKKKYHWK